ncbi:MAG TPA: hypothetical protein VH561_22065 [Micromonosporaceae bacterium]|jgi:hypothetical protein
MIDGDLVADLCAAPVPLSSWPDDPLVPWGPPGAPVGVLWVHREIGQGPRLSNAHRPASAVGWRWLAEQLQRPPAEAYALLRRLGGDGFPDRFIDIGLSTSLRSAPGWIRLYRDVAYTAMTAENQASCLALLGEFADRVNPSYGQIGVVHPFPSATTLETCLPSAYGRNQPWQSIVESRQWLRGYTWVTVLGREHVARLGGIDTISSSGAFYEVVGLSGGGAVVRATEDFREYDQQKAAQIFRALAPVLRPGLPSPPSTTYGAPFLIVYEDASFAAGRESQG